MTSVGSPLTLNKAVIGTQQGFPNPGADGGVREGYSYSSFTILGTALPGNASTVCYAV